MSEVEVEADIIKGRRYSNRKGATNQAWELVQKHAPHLTEQQCREVVKTWLKSGLLYEQEYYDTKLRKKRHGIFVDNAKRPGNTWEN